MTTLFDDVRGIGAEYGLGVVPSAVIVDQGGRIASRIAVGEEKPEALLRSSAWAPFELEVLSGSGTSR